MPRGNVGQSGDLHIASQTFHSNHYSKIAKDAQTNKSGAGMVVGSERAILFRTSSSTFSVSVSLTLCGAIIVLITCLVCFDFTTSLLIHLGLIFWMAKSRSGLFCQPTNADVLWCVDRLLRQNQ